eukprot:sb/3475573/
MLVEVGTQTGSSDTDIQVEPAEIIELEDECLGGEMALDPVKMDADPFYYDSAVPPIDTFSFDNGELMSDCYSSNHFFPARVDAEGFHPDDLFRTHAKKIIQGVKNISGFWRNSRSQNRITEILSR